MEEDLDTGGYEVSLPVFEGPMDLLLHLVTKNRIDIHDIPVHQITDQYLAYLEQAGRFDLNLGSGFFAMAATLLLLKSRMLLPRRRQEDTDEAEDPRQELARSLEEFKKMKEMRLVIESLLLQEAPYRMREPAELASSFYTGRISIHRLTAAFSAVFGEKEEEGEHLLTAEEVSFDEQISRLRALLADGRLHPVQSVFRLQRSRMALAVALVALLEMIRTGEAEIDEQAGGLCVRAKVPARKTWVQGGGDDARD